MNSIKELKKQLQEIVKCLMKNYLITLLGLAGTTLFLAIFITSSNTNIIKLESSLLIWLVGLFFTETYFNNKVSKTIFSIITAFIGIAFSLIIFASDSLISYNISIPLLVGYILILIALILHKLMQKNQANLNEYLINLIENIFYISMFFGILHFGITLLILTFTELITQIDYFQIFSREIVLLLGLFYIPAIMYSMFKVDKEKNRTFIKGLVIYVLLPLVFIAMLIIYMYIIKILFLMEMPSNIIFRILAILYLFSMPTWIMGSYFNENKKINKITSILPYLFAPFILLEIYSIGIRIIDFGMTPFRYLAVMLIIFQIAELLLEKLFKKRNLVFIVIAIIIGIATIYPTNLINTSVIWQNQILKSNYPAGSNFEKLNDEQKRKAIGAYNYLKDANEKKYFQDYTEEERTILESRAENYENSGENWLDYKYINYVNYSRDIPNIQGYKSLYYIDPGQYNKDLKKAIFKYNQDKIVEVDLTNLLDNLQNKDYITIEEYMLKNNKIRIDEQRDFVITYLNVEYKDSYSNVSDIQLDGYILEK